MRFSSRLSIVAAVLLFVAPLAVEAQPARIPRVGVLSPMTTDSPPMKAFEQGLTEQGYVADKTIRLEASTPPDEAIGCSISRWSSPTPRSTSSSSGQAPGP